MAKPRIIATGIITLLLAVFFDQLSKWYMLDVVDIQNRPPIEVTGFFNLVMVWNKGVSFGMFSTHDQPYALIALALVLCVVLTIWLFKAEAAWIAGALGLVIGGALGNVIDRVRFGAVADFFDFYVQNYHWPAFNIADSAIFIGVVLLCIDSMFMHRNKG